MTSKLTRERIQEIINLACKTCSDGSIIYPKAYSTVDSKEIVELARMALAVMDSHAQPAPETEREPIAWLNDAYLARGVVDGEAGSEDAGPGYIPVYREASPVQTAPVVPVSVPDGWKLVPEIPDSQMITAWKDANYNNASLESALRKMLNAAPEPPQAMHVLDEAQSRELFEKWCSVNLERNKWHPEYYLHLPARQQWNAWEACRAAMLQACTLTNEDAKQAWTGIPDIDNAIIMLDRISTVESEDDDRVEAVKAVLRGLAGNSPVIPEGYVMVPKEPTEAMMLHKSGCQHHAWDDPDCAMRQTRRLIWSHMLTAALREVES